MHAVPLSASGALVEQPLELADDAAHGVGVLGVHARRDVRKGGERTEDAAAEVHHVEPQQRRRMTSRGLYSVGGEEGALTAARGADHEQVPVERCRVEAERHLTTGGGHVDEPDRHGQPLGRWRHGDVEAGVGERERALRPGPGQRRQPQRRPPGAVAGPARLPYQHGEVRVVLGAGPGRLRVFTGRRDDRWCRSRRAVL